MGGPTVADVCPVACHLWVRKEESQRLRSRLSHLRWWHLVQMLTRTPMPYEVNQSLCTTSPVRENLREILTAAPAR